MEETQLDLSSKSPCDVVNISQFSKVKDIHPEIYSEPIKEHFDLISRAMIKLK